jgi:predicted DNA-binding transcriptional regulator AlpA
MTIMADDDCVLTFADLREKKRWPYSRVHTRRMWIAGQFPKPFKTGGTGRYNLWLESEVDAYLTGRQKTARNT